MPIVLQVLICALAGGLVSLIGGMLLLASKKRVSLAEYATAFAAGALLASAFVDIIPEALESADGEVVSIFILAGLIIFFILEIVLSWFHKHGSKNKPDGGKSIVPMIIIGDTLHNFIDGIAIAAAFLVSPTSGIIVTLAVAVHEIPQEVGDFGVLLHNGLSRKKVLLANIASSLATAVSAVGFYLFGSYFDISFAPLLGIVAGFFIYIATSDIIPSIHSEKLRSAKLKKMAILLTGVIVVGLAVTALHNFAHTYDNHEHGDTHQTINDHRH